MTFEVFSAVKFQVTKGAKGCHESLFGGRGFGHAHNDNLVFIVQCNNYFKVA
jgi:hypothetical protein